MATKGYKDNEQQAFAPTPTDWLGIQQGSLLSDMKKITYKDLTDPLQGQIDDHEQRVDDLELAEGSIKGVGWTGASLQSLDENKADKATTYTKTEVDVTIDELDTRLDTLEGTGAGSVAKAIDDAVSPIEVDVADHETRISKLEFIPAVTSWADVQRIVREGRASAYFPVGTQFEATWNGISVVWDVIGINHDKPSDPTYTRSLTIQANKILIKGRISAPEAMYNAVTGLPAGTYIFTTNGLQYTFTSTQAVPAGGVIYIKTRSSYVPLTLTIYGANRTSIIEDDIAVTTTTGTDNLSPINYHVRMLRGNNNYPISALRQWLNSDSAAFAWQPLGLYDMPSTYETAGFVNLLDAELQAVIGAVDKQVALATYDDGGQELFSDKVFLLSRVEMGLGTEGVTTGEAVYDFWNGRTNADRIKTNLSGSLSDWWLRSPGVSSPDGARLQGVSGTLYNISVNNSHGLAPACVIY